MNGHERLAAWIDARRLQGMSISELARKMDVSRQTVHSWLNGVIPDASRLKRLHDLTGIPIAELIGKVSA